MGYISVAHIIGLSSFVYPWLPPKVANSSEIPTKFDLTAVQGHPRSSILVSIEGRERTIHEKPDRPRFSICNQREIGGSEPVFSS